MDKKSEVVEFGNYRILRTDDGSLWELGKGGFGTTYKAEHRHLMRISALKVINADRVTSSDARKRFLQEARAAASLQHPNIAAIHDFGEDDGVFYYAMEFCAGGDLEHYSEKNGGMSWDQVKPLALQILGALSHAHKNGLLHRDLKPSNIMLSAEDDTSCLKLIDFGLVKVLEHLETSSTQLMLTREGAAGFNPLTASPEQLREEDLDERSDLFSLGVTLLFLICGGSPFGTLSVPQVMAQRLNEQSYDDVLPDSLQGEGRQIISKMLQKDREQRYRSVEEIIDAIRFSGQEEHSQVKVIEGAQKDKTVDRSLLEKDVVFDWARAWDVTSVQQQCVYGSYYQGVGVVSGVPDAVIFLPNPQTPNYKSVIEYADSLLGKKSSILLSYKKFGYMDEARAYLCDSASLVGGRYLQLLQAETHFTLQQHLPLFLQVASAIDEADQSRLPGVELDASSIIVVCKGRKENVNDLPVSAEGWIEYYKGRLAKDTSFAASVDLLLLPKLEIPRDFEDMGMTLSGDELASNPLALFGSLLYRSISGMSVKSAAYLNPSVYVPTSNLGEESNRYLADVIAAYSSESSALNILFQLCEYEGVVWDLDVLNQRLNLREKEGLEVAKVLSNTDEILKHAQKEARLAKIESDRVSKDVEFKKQKQKLKAEAQVEVPVIAEEGEKEQADRDIQLETKTEKQKVVEEGLSVRQDAERKSREEENAQKQKEKKPADSPIKVNVEKKGNFHEDPHENPQVGYGKDKEWIKKNKLLLGGVTAGVILLVVGSFIFFGGGDDKEAQTATKGSTSNREPMQQKKLGVESQTVEKPKTQAGKPSADIKPQEKYCDLTIPLEDADSIPDGVRLILRRVDDNIQIGELEKVKGALKLAKKVKVKSLPLNGKVKIVIKPDCYKLTDPFVLSMERFEQGQGLWEYGGCVALNMRAELEFSPVLKYNDKVLSADDHLHLFSNKSYVKIVDLGGGLVRGGALFYSNGSVFVKMPNGWSLEKNPVKVVLSVPSFKPVEFDINKNGQVERRQVLADDTHEVDLSSLPMKMPRFESVDIVLDDSSLDDAVKHLRKRLKGNGVETLSCAEFTKGKKVTRELLKLHGQLVFRGGVWCENEGRGVVLKNTISPDMGEVRLPVFTKGLFMGVNQMKSGSYDLWMIMVAHFCDGEGLGSQDPLTVYVGLNYAFNGESTTRWTPFPYYMKIKDYDEGMGWSVESFVDKQYSSSSPLFLSNLVFQGDSMHTFYKEEVNGVKVSSKRNGGRWDFHLLSKKRNVQDGVLIDRISAVLEKVKESKIHLGNPSDTETRIISKEDMLKIIKGVRGEKKYEK